MAGFVEAPDNVGFPLAKPRFYVSRAAIDAQFGPEPDPQTNLAEIWLRDPRYLNEVLVQARTTSFGLRDLRIATHSGVRVLLDQAAGIVIDLLVALSLIALLTAGVMLAASSRAEVQRRLAAIGVRRAVGAGRGHVALALGLQALLVAVPAATVGALAGVLATAGPGNRLLTLLNEPPPGSELVLPLAAGWLTSILIPALGAGWPAWRAAGRPPVELLRGAELGGTAKGGRRRGHASLWAAGGLRTLGARLVAARRVRLTATIVTLGLSTAFVLLMLALASALSALETDPGALGKRYQLTASLPVAATAQVAAIPGVRVAAPRYEVQAADSFSLGETIDVVAYPGDHTVFEAPPLSVGRRLRGPGQAEVGIGLADALGLSPGSSLALALPSGAELRLRVAGLVSSLDHDGRVAYIPAGALVKADPSAPYQIAVRLQPHASQATVTTALSALGAQHGAGEWRNGPRCPAGRRSAGDPARGGHRGRARLPVRADPGLRADGAGAQEDRGGASGVRGGPGGCAAAAARSRALHPDTGGGRGHPARAPGLRSRAGQSGCELCHFAPRGDRGRGPGHPRRACPHRWIRRLLGGTSGRPRVGCRWSGVAVRRITRRQALTEALAGAILIEGCGGGGGKLAAGARNGSTLESTWRDPSEDGQLRIAPGEPLLDRTDLGPRAAGVTPLATLAHVTDAHVLDASSPARVSFLDRLGRPFQSTFRPRKRSPRTFWPGQPRPSVR